MANNKVPFRLERFNLVTDEWEIFYTSNKSHADHFLDNSPSDKYTSVGYITNPATDWLHNYRNWVGVFVPKYTPGADYDTLRKLNMETV